MKIKFKNGNIIESIESSESKRSRGYRNLVTFVDDMWGLFNIGNGLDILQISVFLSSKNRIIR